MKTTKYDLEERTLKFTIDVRKFVRNLKVNIANKDALDQLVRSSGSVGANYIEANECLGKQDFKMRIKISRKEAKESAFWLKVILETNIEPIEEAQKLLKEAKELELILGAILRNSK